LNRIASSSSVVDLNGQDSHHLEGSLRLQHRINNPLRSGFINALSQWQMAEVMSTAIEPEIFSTISYLPRRFVLTLWSWDANLRDG
jgi:hypothetical protein